MKKLSFALVALILLACKEQMTVRQTSLVLHYDAPAEFFEEALPIGNGRLCRHIP